MERKPFEPWRIVAEEAFTSDQLAACIVDFAIEAMQGMLADPLIPSQVIPERAWDMAEAMVKEGQRRLKAAFDAQAQEAVDTGKAPGDIERTRKF